MRFRIVLLGASGLPPSLPFQVWEIARPNPDTAARILAQVVYLTVSDGSTDGLLGDASERGGFLDIEEVIVGAQGCLKLGGVALGHVGFSGHAPTSNASPDEIKSAVYDGLAEALGDDRRRNAWS